MQLREVVGVTSEFDHDGRRSTAIDGVDDDE